MLFMSSYGLHDASSTLIGNSIGQPYIKVATARAWRFASIISIVTLVALMITLLPLFILRNEIAAFLATDPKVVELVMETLPIVFISYVLESFQL
mmetsp:Transcript_25138/g.33690  ORF Transcript_25138/g.33690 Transcript_25138/m.33690 type:complete len:95 (+) Transcript_25138:95-379(+)